MKGPLFLELQRLIAKYGTSSGTAIAPLPHVIVARVDAPTEPHPHLAEPMFSLVAQGAKHVSLDEEVFDYGTGEYLITSVDLPVTAHITRATKKVPFLGVGIALQPQEVANLLIESGGSALSPFNGSGGRAIGVSKLTDELVESVVRLLRLLGKPSDIPILAPAIEREIHWRLLTGPQGARMRQIGSTHSHTFQVSSAIRWIRANYRETLRIDTLARIAGMSVTSFHRRFREVTSMTPIQFQKHIRLQEARMRLLSSKDDVTTVGVSVGYESPSQFSREYRRLFGAPPGRDGERLRHSSTLSIP
jgi:AraC-like DNA-binding protein